MTHTRSAIAASLLVATLASAALRAEAQEQPETTPELRDKFDQLLRGLTDQIEPVMRDLAAKFYGIIDQIDDLDNYSSPEILPNGDIIIRRLEDAPDHTAPDGDFEEPGTDT